jgi:hypothetical protein
MLCTDVAKLEGPKELVAEDSPITDCLPGRTFKRTTAAICNIRFFACQTKKKNIIITCEHILEITTILTINGNWQ